MGGIQLVIPMAGQGSRFAQAGYSKPKPLLPIHGVPMYQVVLANLYSDFVSDVIFLARADFCLAGDIARLDEKLNCRVALVEISETTDGPASTVALAEPLIRPDAPLITANSDQYVAQDPVEFAQETVSGDADGLIMTMNDSHPKWSYAATDASGQVSRVAEKVVISNKATVGIYAFASARYFFDSYAGMVRAEDKVNGEYYVAPTFNYLISRGQPVLTHHVGRVMDVMYGMGTPEDYEGFLLSETSRLAAREARWLLGD